LLAPTPIVCVGQGEVNLEAVLTNTSDQQVEISSEGVAHIFAATKFDSDKEVGSSGGLRDVIYRQWVRISPHQSVLVPFSERAKDQFGLANLLDSPGLIELRIGFQVNPRERRKDQILGGTVYSNSVLLPIKNCTA